MIQLKPGDKAPYFSLKDQNGNIMKLDDFRGRKLLVYFYPKADTPGCTKQACSVRDSYIDLASAGITTIGISPDIPEEQKKFDEKYNLGFPLLADSDHSVSIAYGVWDKIICGEECAPVVKRSSFLVDEDGKIIQAWYDVKPEDTVPNALNALEVKNSGLS